MRKRIKIHTRGKPSEYARLCQTALRAAKRAATAYGYDPRRALGYLSLSLPDPDERELERLAIECEKEEQF